LNEKLSEYITQSKADITHHSYQFDFDYRRIAISPEIRAFEN